MTQNTQTNDKHRVTKGTKQTHTDAQTTQNVEMNRSII